MFESFENFENFVIFVIFEILELLKFLKSLKFLKFLKFFIFFKFLKFSCCNRDIKDRPTAKSLSGLLAKVQSQNKLTRRWTDRHKQTIYCLFFKNPIFVFHHVCEKQSSNSRLFEVLLYSSNFIRVCLVSVTYLSSMASFVFFIIFRYVLPALFVNIFRIYYF